MATLVEPRQEPPRLQPVILVLGEGFFEDLLLVRDAAELEGELDEKQREGREREEDDERPQADDGLAEVERVPDAGVRAGHDELSCLGHDGERAAECVEREEREDMADDGDYGPDDRLREGRLRVRDDEHEEAHEGAPEGHHPRLKTVGLANRLKAEEEENAAQGDEQERQACPIVSA